MLCVSLQNAGAAAPQLSLTLCDHSPSGYRVQGDIGEGCHALFQGIFLAQGSNLCLLHLLHCGQILYRQTQAFGMLPDI